MAIQFPSWWSASADSEPLLFNHPNDVPPGWVHRVGTYDTEIGQFVTAEQAEKRAAEKRKFQQEQTREEFAEADEAAKEDKADAEAQIAEIERDAPEPRAKKRRGKPKKGAKKMANNDKQPGAVNEGAKGIARPQDNETPADVNDPGNVARERGGDGVVRTGNRPTKR